MSSNELNNSQKTYDVFLSHNSQDKPIVRELKQKLEKKGLSCWLDEDELPPGALWQELLEQGIRASKSVVVLVGKDGIGPWENEEMRAALQLAAQDKRPIITAMLVDAKDIPSFPLFLTNRTWVDLRPGITRDNIDRLIWGITGNKQNKKSTPKKNLPPISPESKTQFAHRMLMLLDKNDQVTRINEINTTKKHYAFIITGAEEEYLDAVSYRLAFELDSSIENFLDPMPIQIRSLKKNLNSHDDMENAFWQSLMKDNSGHENNPSCLDKLKQEKRNQVFLLRTYPLNGSHLSAEQLKKLIHTWESDIIKKFITPPYLVIILEDTDENLGSMCNQILRALRLNKSFTRRYERSLKNHELDLHILPKPTSPLLNHINEWLNFINQCHFINEADKDKIADLASELFKNKKPIPHSQFYKKLKIILASV